MKRLGVLFAFASVGLLLAWVMLAPAPSPAEGLREAARRWLYLGPPLMEVRTPEAGLELPVGAVEVLVAFPGGPRVAVETFECWLNGHDVTASLTLGRNGAAGSIVGLHEGDNQIRLRVFGRSWWGGDYFEEQRWLLVRVRPLAFLDMA